MALMFSISLSEAFLVGWLWGQGDLPGPGLQCRDIPVPGGWECSALCPEPQLPGGGCAWPGPGEGSESPANFCFNVVHHKK